MVDVPAYAQVGRGSEQVAFRAASLQLAFEPPLSPFNNLALRFE